MSDKRLDIFGLLRNIDKQNIEYYSALSDDEKKAFAPVVLMQWMFCLKNPSENPLQRILLNEVVNPYIFKLYKHPELLYYLMCVCAPGYQQQYKWKKPNVTESKFPRSLEIVKRVYGYSTKLAEQSMPVLTNEDILQFAIDLGTDADEMKKLKQELKKR